MIADNLRNPRQVRKIETFLISSQRMGDLYKLEFPFMGKTSTHKVSVTIFISKYILTSKKEIISRSTINFRSS